MTERPDLKAGSCGRLLGPAEPEVGCDACFDQLDRYVELELAGADADATTPRPARPPAGLPRLPRGAREPPRPRQRRAFLALGARLVVRRFDRLRVQRALDVLARIDVGDRLLDLAHAPPQLARELRNPLRAEQEQEDDSQRDQLPLTRHPSSIDSGERSAARMTPNRRKGRRRGRHSRVRCSRMKRTLLIALLALGLILLAVGAWTLQGIRWTLRGGRNRRERLATA